MEVVENRENYIISKHEIIDELLNKKIDVFICFSYLTPIAYYNLQEELIIVSNNVTTQESIAHLRDFCGDRNKRTTAQINIDSFVRSL